MGAIEDVYTDLDTDIEFDEFETAVEEKVEEMGGLADEETAAMLIAHEIRDDEVEGVADIKPDMDEAKFLAKIQKVGEMRTFERDEEETDGHVMNLTVADETGQIRITLWDELATDAAEKVNVGQVLRVSGRPKEGFNGIEVDVNKVEPAPDEEVAVEALDSYRIEDLSLGLSDVNLEGRVLDTDSVRTFDRDDGTEGHVSNLQIGDPTGRTRVTLWDEQAPLANELDAGDCIEVVDGYVREREGTLELHVSGRGDVNVIDKTIGYDPQTRDIESLSIDETVDLAGGVIEIGDKRTFDRDDGSQGQVRNIRVKDETGDMRIALWGDKADLDIDLADYIVCTAAEIQEGWQDDLEASAGWQSTVTKLDRDPPGASTPDDSSSPANDGLAAFDTPSRTSETSEATETSETTAQPSEAVQTAQTEEFTGTVVQAGSPVILDDGSETRRVVTDSSLRLGERVTVTGPIQDDKITAESIEREE